MKGTKLNEEAVRLAQQIDIATEQIVTQIRGTIEAGNATRLREIGISTDPGIVTSSGPVLEAARGLISMGQPTEALAVLSFRPRWLRRPPTRAHICLDIRPSQQEDFAHNLPVVSDSPSNLITRVTFCCR